MKTRHIFAITIGILILLVDFVYFLDTGWFIPLIVIAVTIAWFQLWIDFFVKRAKQKELETRFPDFVRNLVGAIKSGMPLGQAIEHVAKTDYGALSYYARKLANQVSWGIPIHKALISFANGTRNVVIKRAIATVIEAERAGGNIEDVLESVTESVISIKNIKEARKASVHSQTIQSYIIFFVFLAVMLIIQNFLIPYMLEMEEEILPGLEVGGVGIIRVGFGGIARRVAMDFSSFPALISSFQRWALSLNGIFLMIALIEGFFAGVIIGKLAVGELRAGLKHSLILMTIAFLVISLSQGLLI